MLPLQSISPETILYAFIGGLLPALIWLHFLLKEDRRNPEPRTVIFIAFLAGMAAVPIAIPLESFFRDYAYTQYPLCSAYSSLCLPILMAWAAIEETLKYLLAAMLVLWRRDVDEPIDFVIYMLTVALGFAALENTLFLIEPFSTGQIVAGLATDNLRFVGSTLLHVIASSAIGFSLAFTYKMPRAIKQIAASTGLILAIALHTTFNFFIIPRDGSGTILTAFLFVWSGAVIFFAVFEILKYFEYRQAPKLSPIKK
jgi:RsiW-degrading membrane proteinase PrsW (M82 family)